MLFPFQMAMRPWLINGGDPITTSIHWEPILQRSGVVSAIFYVQHVDLGEDMIQFDGGLIFFRWVGNIFHQETQSSRIENRGEWQIFGKYIEGRIFGPKKPALIRVRQSILERPSHLQ